PRHPHALGDPQERGRAARSAGAGSPGPRLRCVGHAAGARHAASRTAGRVSPLGGARLMLIDSHCHLNYKGLVEDQAAVLDRARARGVTGMLNISTREREWDEIIATAEREPDVWASVGIHPHEADEHPDVDAA